MFFELSNDLVPIILSMSLYLTVLGLQLVNGMAQDYAMSRRSIANESLRTIEVNSSNEEEATEEMGQKQNFITRIVKRKEAPEDDSDYLFSSIKMDFDRKRGGQRWKINLYSTSLKGMVFSF
ncbi:hypothetical protein J2S74_004388 [Evansella vedderi]|uniref:Uncharacterized protein n=1 Tax=Evansella vedderi TaxID=38282 RepID=A0ABU0A2N0_9BACI|nr:hypothetical protein [Evansella vedderi]MDQ0256943.1 hypothetical protein [Evansella vedderi]